MRTTFHLWHITIVALSALISVGTEASGMTSNASTSRASTLRAARAAQPRARAVPSALADMDNSRLADLAARLMRKNLADSALLCYELVNTREAGGDRSLYARTLHEAGVIYYDRSLYGKAMERYMASLQICEEEGLGKELATLYKDIGNVYSMFRDYKQSSVLYKKSLALARKYGDNELVNKVLNNLIFAYTEDTPPAQYRKWQREIASRHEKRTRYAYDVYMTDGQVLIYEGHTEKAIAAFRKAVECGRARRLDPINLASAYGFIGSLYLQEGQADSALAYVERNRQIANETGNTALLATTLRTLSKIYAGIDKDKSMAYKQEYLVLSDSLYNNNEYNSIRNALYFHEMDAKSKAIDKLSLENLSQSRTISWQHNALILLTVCLLVFLILFMVIARQKFLLSKAYRALFNKNQEDIITKNAYSQAIKNMEAKVEALQQGGAGAKATISVKETGADDGKTAAKGEKTDKAAPRLPEELKNELLNSILYVMENTEAYCDSDFGIEKLATMIGSNSRYVSQVINDVYKENFRTFLNSYRVKKAMMRMNDSKNYGHYTIRAIAESVGYKSQANFINVFTKITGIKPSVFQKMSMERLNEPNTLVEDDE